MKILRVEIMGFGPFPGQEVIDFESFASDGKFVITGRTGAGKSSILDAITFALFGHVPRYGSVGGDSTVRSDFLHNSAEPTEVAVEFATDGGRYRVTRQPSFTPPGNKNPRAQFADIAQWKSGTWEVLASRKIKEVGFQISQIVGLSAEQFQQVILLAQGQFQEFLVADSTERRKLLRKLFDTGRYLDYSEDLDDRASRLGRELELVAQAVRTSIESLANTVDETPPEDLDPRNGSAVRAWVDPLRAAQAQLLEQASAEVQEKQKALEVARAARDEAKLIAAAQQRLGEATAELARLSAAEESINAERQRLAQARKADLCWVAVQARDHAAKVEADAAKSLLAAQRGFEEHHGVVSQSADEIQNLEDKLLAETTRLKGVAEIEMGLPALRTAADRAEAALVTLNTKLEAWRRDREQLQDNVKALDLKLEPISAQAATKAAADATMQSLTIRLGAVKAVLETERRLSAAQTEAKAAETGVNSATKAHDDLIARRLADYAATLAATLTDGQPCVVCGSEAHPKKATPAAGTVSEEAIDEAQQQLNTAKARLDEARAKVSNLEGQLSAQRQGTQGASVESITAELEAARQAVKVAEVAEGDQRSLAGQRDEAHNRIIELGQDIEKAQQDYAAKQGEAARAQQKLKSAEESVAQASGGAESVASRLAEATAGLKAARDLRRALNTHESASAALQTSAAAMAQSLNSNGFAEADEVIKARVSKDEQDQIEETIRKHDSEVDAVTKALADPQLQGLPDEPVDVATPEEAARLADEDHQAAIGRHGQVRRQHTQVEQTYAEITKSMDQASETQREYDVVDRLARTVRGQSPNTQKMSLETFALAADLEDIVNAANVLLAKMTANRYELRHSDEIAKGGGQSGLAIDVIDAYSGEARAPASLSGGEKFQASLALALGLAEVVTSRNGGLNLDTLFIDEGFGTLDQETLEVTLDTVDSLREGGRMVGLISHVPEVKERIPHHINVQVTDEGWSTLGGSQG